MIINNIYKERKAFTLIETILYMSLFVAIFAALFASLNIFYSNKIKNRTILEVEQQGQIISLIISQEIRNAQSIISPVIGVSADTLILEHFDILKSPLSFYLLDNKIMIDENGNLFNLSNSNVVVNSLIFENNSAVDGAQSISFSFDISYDSNVSRNEYKYNKSFSSTVNLLKK